MKKRILILMLVLGCLFCSVSIGNCKGKLYDLDAFSSYIGKTRAEVRRISPTFEEFDENCYIVDYQQDGDDFLALAVIFDHYNLVQSVLVLVTKGALPIIGIEDSMDTVASFGAVLLGFTGDDSLGTYTDLNGNYIINIKGGITISTTILYEKLYAVVSTQK